MHTFLIVLHLLVCFLMIASILLQAGKGAEIGASFGGSSQTVFGSRGPGTFLSKVTVGAALIFMLTSLSLAILSRGDGVSSSVIDVPTTSQESSSTEATNSSTSDSTQSESTASESPSSDTAPQESSDSNTNQ
ncbi:MAG: preprotein translocase subunit SecG [Nitrospirota bacterium]|nr:preprotein translocase subunit SecG [Nitrospirota bacterium]